MNQYFDVLFRPFRKPRVPAETGHILALTGAVVIHTEDGYNVVLTPTLARDIAPFLPSLADEAEKTQPGVAV